MTDQRRWLRVVFWIRFFRQSKEMVKKAQGQWPFQYGIHGTRGGKHLDSSSWQLMLLCSHELQGQEMNIQYFVLFIWMSVPRRLKIWHCLQSVLLVQQLRKMCGKGVLASMQQTFFRLCILWVRESLSQHLAFNSRGNRLWIIQKQFR